MECRKKASRPRTKCNSCKACKRKQKCTNPLGGSAGSPLQDALPAKRLMDEDCAAREDLDRAVRNNLILSGGSKYNMPGDHELADALCEAGLDTSGKITSQRARLRAFLKKYREGEEDFRVEHGHSKPQFSDASKPLLCQLLGPKVAMQVFDENKFIKLWKIEVEDQDTWRVATLYHFKSDPQKVVISFGQDEFEGLCGGYHTPTSDYSMVTDPDGDALPMRLLVPPAPVPRAKRELQSELPNQERRASRRVAGTHELWPAHAAFKQGEIVQFDVYGRPSEGAVLSVHDRPSDAVDGTCDEVKYLIEYRWSDGKVYREWLQGSELRVTHGYE